MDHGEQGEVVQHGDDGRFCRPAVLCDEKEGVEQDRHDDRAGERRLKEHVAERAFHEGKDQCQDVHRDEQDDADDRGDLPAGHFAFFGILAHVFSPDPVKLFVSIIAREL